MKTYLITATAALVFSAAQAFGATLLIDGFDADQRVTDVPSSGFVNASQVSGGDILGGFRDLSVMNTFAQGNDVNATELNVTGSSLSFSNINQARGRGLITYDGDDDPTTLNTSGLGGINFLIGPDPRFVFEVEEFDRNVFIEIDVYDTMGRRVSYSETLASGFNPNLSFSELSGDAGFDFSSVGAIQFFVDSTDTIGSVDGAIRSISVVAIPLPATALLLLGSMGGLTLLRSRRSKV